MAAPRAGAHIERRFAQKNQLKSAENVALHFRERATLQQAKSMTYLTSTRANCRRWVRLAAFRPNGREKARVPTLRVGTLGPCPAQQRGLLRRWGSAADRDERSSPVHSVCVVAVAVRRLVVVVMIAVAVRRLVVVVVIVVAVRGLLIVVVMIVVVVVVAVVAVVAVV